MILEPIRWVLGKGVLTYEKFTQPIPVERTPEAQATVDNQTSGMALYEFLACPFCMKVRKVMHRKSLHIERRDARRNGAWKQELIQDGGKYQTPCLKITDSDGAVTWMYESNDIIKFLNERFPD